MANPIRFYFVLDLRVKTFPCILGNENNTIGPQYIDYTFNNGGTDIKVNFFTYYSHTFAVLTRSLKSIHKSDMIDSTDFITDFTKFGKSDSLIDVFVDPVPLRFLFPTDKTAAVYPADIFFI